MTDSVLIVDDDEGIAHLERRTLIKAGVAVTLAHRVADALGLLERESYDAIVLDCSVPGGNPWEVVEVARARTPRIPVLVVTATGSEQVAAEALHRGVADYLIKHEQFCERLPAAVERVTRAARLEEQRRRSEAFFALVASNVTDLISIADGRGCITYISPSCRRIIGYEPEELVGQRGVSLLHPEDHSRSITTDAMSGGESHLRRTSRYRHKDGGYVWLEVSSFVSRDRRGAALEMVSICRDVTERKRAEDELGRERARLAEAQQIAHLGSWEWEMPGDTVTWSDELYRICGVARGSFVPGYASLRTLLHPADRAGVDAQFAEAYRDDRPVETEYRIVRPDGEVRALRGLSRVVVRDEQGHPRRIAGTVQDVTAQRRLEEIADSHAAELYRSNEQLEQFAYAASHDLRAPLRAISALAQWIEQDSGDRLTPESSGHLALLHKRVARMDRLLVDLLEYSRADQLQSAVEPVDTAALLAEVREAAERPPQFTVEIGSAMPALVTCRVPLQQVFRNLVDNAIKHHDRWPRGAVRVSAREGEDQVWFSVADDGPGIPAEHRQEVFRMFRTLKPRDAVEGSGMGLALVRKIVELAGGSIRIEDGTERGTTVTFSWPRCWRGRRARWPG
jgi:PAS domain S-box-containing protein